MASSVPPPDPYEDTVGRARSALAALNRALTDLATPTNTPDVDSVLQNLRDDLQRQRG